MAAIDDLYKSIKDAFSSQLSNTTDAQASITQISQMVGDAIATYFTAVGNGGNGGGAALGETSTTAYRGDRGKQAYDHSQITHDKALVGLANVDNTADTNKPVSNAQAAANNAILTSANNYTNNTVNTATNNTNQAISNVDAKLGGGNIIISATQPVSPTLNTIWIKPI